MHIFRTIFLFPRDHIIAKFVPVRTVHMIDKETFPNSFSLKVVECTRTVHTILILQVFDLVDERRANKMHVFSVFTVILRKTT